MCKAGSKYSVPEVVDEHSAADAVFILLQRATFRLTPLLPVLTQGARASFAAACMGFRKGCRVWYACATSSLAYALIEAAALRAATSSFDVATSPWWWPSSLRPPAVVIDAVASATAVLEPQNVLTEAVAVAVAVAKLPLRHSLMDVTELVADVKVWPLPVVMAMACAPVSS